ncbi:MAG: response regulator [Solirubrobacterales bacterium]
MNLNDPKNDIDILVVDDTQLNLAVLTDLLTGEGYQIRSASNGPDALTAAFEAVPDLILLDIIMPGMDGYEVCLKLKADERTRDVPVIFISALDEVTDKIMGFEVGGVDYIQKPFQSGEVLARVHTRLTLSRLRKQLARQNAELSAEIERRTQLEAELRQTRAEEAEIIRFIPLILICLNSDDCVTQWNPAAQETLEMAADEVLGKKLADCPIRWNWVRLAPVFEECRRLGKMVESEDVTFRREDGFDAVLSFAVSPMSEESSTQPGLIILGTDISAWRSGN